jgi:hypothetical protein
MEISLQIRRSGVGFGERGGAMLVDKFLEDKPCLLVFRQSYLTEA